MVAAVPNMPIAVVAAIRQKVVQLSSEVLNQFHGILSENTANPIPTQSYSQKFRITQKNGTERAFTFTAGLSEESNAAAIAETTAVAGYDTHIGG